jgi:hypothetical protein
LIHQEKFYGAIARKKQSARPLILPDDAVSLQFGPIPGVSSEPDVIVRKFDLMIVNRSNANSVRAATSPLDSIIVRARMALSAVWRKGRELEGSGRSLSGPFMAAVEKTGTRSLSE